MNDLFNEISNAAQVLGIMGAQCILLFICLLAVAIKWPRYFIETCTLIAMIILFFINASNIEGFIAVTFGALSILTEFFQWMDRRAAKKTSMTEPPRPPLSRRITFSDQPAGPAQGHAE